jgi:hypothetical protein
MNGEGFFTAEDAERAAADFAGGAEPRPYDPLYSAVNKTITFWPDRSDRCS